MRDCTTHGHVLVDGDSPECLACGQLLTSLGEDPLPGAWPEDLSQLTQALSTSESQAAAKLGASL